MDAIVSLCKRRGFVFPSSEIYGGLGSSYDYGHYGVLLKATVQARWLEARVRERDDTRRRGPLDLEPAAERAQRLGHERRRLVLLERQLRVCMQMPAPGNRASL